MFKKFFLGIWGWLSSLNRLITIWVLLSLGALVLNEPLAFQRLGSLGVAMCVIFFFLRLKEVEDLKMEFDNRINSVARDELLLLDNKVTVLFKIASAKFRLLRALRKGVDISDEAEMDLDEVFDGLEDVFGDADVLVHESKDFSDKKNACSTLMTKTAKGLMKFEVNGTLFKLNP